MTSTLTCSIIYLLTSRIISMLTCTISSMLTCTIASIRLHIRLALRRPGPGAGALSATSTLHLRRPRAGTCALSASSTLDIRGRGISPASPRHLP